MEDHSYSLAQEKPRQREYSSLTKRKIADSKRSRDRRRQKTRINIGAAFPRWKTLMRDKCFQSDTEVACFLLDRDDDGSSGICALDENQEVDVLQERVQVLRALVKQRLTAAIDEILKLFEGTIAEYEVEIDRQRRLLEDAVKPEIQINTADGPQLCKEEFSPKQQQWSPSLDQENPEPPHIKEEQEELLVSQEGEQLQGLEEADITKFPFTPVPVKSEDDEEGPQFSQLHQSQSEENRETEPLASTSTEQMKTEADGDCGGSEPASNLDPASDLQPNSDDQRQRVQGQTLSVSNKFRRTSPHNCVKITRVQMLRALVNQRLTAAVEETFGLFARTRFACQHQVPEIYDIVP